MSTDGTRKEVKYTVLQVHERLGHSNEDATRATADVIGMKLRKGGWEPALHAQLENQNRKM
jgi:hypothetical protein